MTVSTKVKKDQPSELVAKADQAAMLLAMGKTGRETAAELGVTPETISRWRSTDTFRVTENRYRVGFLQAARDNCRMAVTTALTTLTEIMNDKTQSTTDRIKAAGKILDVSDFQTHEGVNRCGETSLMRYRIANQYEDGS